MMRLKLEQQETKLNQLFSKVESVADEETKAILSKFLCVRTSGYIEAALKALVNEFVSGSSPKCVQRFVNDKMRTVTNLKYERILNILSSYDDDWSRRFSELITEEQRAALNSIVSNRNNISHGENDSVSYELMKGYFEHAKHVVRTLKEIVKK